MPHLNKSYSIITKKHPSRVLELPLSSVTPRRRFTIELASLYDNPCLPAGRSRFSPPVGGTFLHRKPPTSWRTRFPDPIRRSILYVRGSHKNNPVLRIISIKNLKWVFGSAEKLSELDFARSRLRENRVRSRCVPQPERNDTGSQRTKDERSGDPTENRTPI